MNIMNSINLNSQPSQLLLLPLEKHNQSYQPTTFHLSSLFSSYSTNNKRGRFSIVSQVHSLNHVQAFPTSLTTLALAKPPDTSVLFIASAVLMVAYIITNFVVPKIITKSFGLGEADEDEKPKKN